MQPQKVIPGTINVEGYAWGYGGRVLLEGMNSMLKEMGLRILNFFELHCSGDYSRPQPVNIARRALGKSLA